MSLKPYINKEFGYLEEFTNDDFFLNIMAYKRFISIVLDMGLIITFYAQLYV